MKYDYDRLNEDAKQSSELALEKVDHIHTNKGSANCDFVVVKVPAGFYVDPKMFDTGISCLLKWHPTTREFALRDASNDNGDRRAVYCKHLAQELRDRGHDARMVEVND